MPYLIRFLLISAVTMFFSCDHESGEHEAHEHSHDQHEHHEGHHHGDANEHMNQNSFEDLVARFEDPERDSWQKPDEVMVLFGDLTNKSIIDIGAGTGYFAFRFADKDARVIAADVDDRFLEYMRTEKEKRGLTDEKFQLRKVPYNSPALGEAEVDAAIIVNTYHHIEDRSTYFAKVLAGLKDDGVLCVVDFQKKESEGEPFGPPMAMRIDHSQVVAELRTSGFTQIDINDALLPHQYIVWARK